MGKWVERRMAVSPPSAWSVILCFSFHFVFHLPPPQGEVSPRQRQQGGEGILQVERPVAQCRYKSPAPGLPPGCLDLETRVHSAGQGRVQSSSGGFSQAVLPAPKVPRMPTRTSQSRWFLLLSVWSKNEMDF